MVIIKGLCGQTVHELMRNPNSTSGVIEYFPAHPHEGAVGVPEDEEHAEVIATGTSTLRPSVQLNRGV